MRLAKLDACTEDNMHDKEGEVISFMRNVLTGHEFDTLPGGLPAHVTPRSMEEIADALKPSAKPCPDWMKAY
ncbi:MAG: hypothetical protein GYA24_06510 [Candidatus Lokiarchaeota archaeon]|nr:hypothetical protein [Candidatus Lokiarchaeota archaeon]